MKDSNLVELPAIRPEKVREEIARIAQEEQQKIVFLDHAIDRQMQRGITSKQIINTLKHGRQVGKVNYCSEKEKRFRCRIELITAGVKVSVIAKLVTINERKCLVVSTWMNGSG